jgi:hypothetical protein
MVLDNDYYMLVKKRHLNTTTPKLTNQNEKRLFPIFSSLFILVILGLIYFTMMPHWTSDEAVPPAEFSTKRALNQVEVFKKTTLCRFTRTRSSG